MVVSNLCSQEIQIQIKQSLGREPSVDSDHMAELILLNPCLGISHKYITLIR